MNLQWLSLTTNQAYLIGPYRCMTGSGYLSSITSNKKQRLYMPYIIGMHAQCTFKMQRRMHACIEPGLIPYLLGHEYERIYISTACMDGWAVCSPPELPRRSYINLSCRAIWAYQLACTFSAGIALIPSLLGVQPYTCFSAVSQWERQVYI